MSLAAAVSAFAHRGARKSAAWSLVIYSGLLALALVLLAAWLVPDARRADLELISVWSAYPDGDWKLINPDLWTTLALADVFALFVLGAIAFLIAPAVIAATVANERRIGTLDQLRTTPLSPLALAAGLIVGAPARLWLLCAGPLAIHVLAAVAGPLPLVTLLQSILVLAVGGAAACSIGLCVALAPRQESGGAFSALGVAAVMFALSSLALMFSTDRQLVCWSFVHPSGALDTVMLGSDGLWRRMLLGAPRAVTRFDDATYALQVSLTPLISLAVSFVLGAILMRASCRKLAHPESPLLSKPLALSLFALAAATVTGPIVLTSRLGDGFDGAAALALSLLIAPAVIAIGLFATPTFESWSMGLRRGRTRWTSDAAAPHRLVWLMALGWTALMLSMVGRHVFHSLDGNERWALALIALAVVSLPCHLLFAATRFPTVAGRSAFAVAILVHAIAQSIAVGMLWSHDLPLERLNQSYVVLASVFAVAVPAWVAWRQHVIARDARLARA